MNITKSKYYTLLFVGFFIYSTTSILSKLASNEQMFSTKYFLYYFGIIFVLGIYALLWQQILKHIDLSIAMSFKPVVLILNYMWAILLFNEKISIKTMIGILLIAIGILVIGARNE